MERKKYNPTWSAELTMEQNTNMIDGVINNLPPERERPVDRVKEPPRPERTLEREER